MATSYQSHESSPIKWGLLRSCLGGSETSQGRVPQSHESDPIWGQLMVQGSSCCNRCLHHQESSPNKWGLLRSCLGGSETSQGRDPQASSSPQPRADSGRFLTRIPDAFLTRDLTLIVTL